MENKPAPQANQAEAVRSIPIDKIIPSPFEPQARRRKKFLDNEIAALAASISQFGLRQPILVRPLADEFEIVFGERRFLSVRKAGFEFINCFVENLSDAETIELQYEENHNRLEPDPLDDAFTFQYLKNEKGYSIHDLSIKFKIGEGAVLRRLKLNDLIPEAKQQLSDGSLPLGHAVYMASFSADVQKKIVDDEMAYGYEGREAGTALTLAEFKQDVEMSFVRKLSSAPFDTNNPLLHLKGLVCSLCTERTGYEPLLFDENLSAEDTCLNKTCFELKTNTQLRIKQDEINEKLKRATPTVQFAAASDSSPPTAIKEAPTVPLVTDRSSYDKDRLSIKGKVLTDQKLLDKPECEFSEIGLAIPGATKQGEVYICQNNKCPTHHPEINSPTEKSGPTDYELQQMEKRFQIEVAMTVRERVLAKSIEHFTGSNIFWQYADLTEKLIVEFVLERSYYLKQHIGILKDFKNLPKDLSDRDAVEAFVRDLNQRRKDQLLFLAVFCRDGYMTSDMQYRSQSEIEKLAESYAKLDYDRLDADMRVELAPEEFKEQAETYRDEFQKKPTVIPRFWWFPFEFPD